MPRKKTRELENFHVDGNNGGSYIRIEEISEGMVHLEVGETCIRTVKMDISVTALACILTWVRDRGFQSVLDEYLAHPQGTPETIGLDFDLAVKSRKK